jgi:hypothetical protein
MSNPSLGRDPPPRRKIETLNESFTIHVDNERRLITVLMEGYFTDTGLTRMFVHLRTMSEFTNEYSVLLDARHITKVHLTAHGVFTLAQASQGDKNRIAIVVGAGAAFGMARMYQTVADQNSDRIGVFTDIQPALQDHLGIPPDTHRRSHSVPDERVHRASACMTEDAIRPYSSISAH